MQWKLFATLAESADGDVTVDVEGETTLREAVDALVETHPDLEEEVLDDSGDLQEHIRLLHEGRDPFTEEDGWETTVDPDDELAVFPPVSGG